MDYPTPEGQFRLELELCDFDHADVWDQVNVSDVEVALQRKLPCCVPAQPHSVGSAAQGVT